MQHTATGMETYYLMIDQGQTIRGLQREFNSHFPFLKIEFIREQSVKGSRDPKNLVITRDEVISELQKKSLLGSISYNNMTTVHELENTFLTNYGLNVQVFRKSGNIWLVTTSTDDWTLEQQNEEGRSIAQHLNIEPEDLNDHDVY